MGAVTTDQGVVLTQEGYAEAVKFRDSARLDTSRVSDVRGRRGPGLAIGGGGLGIVGVILALVLGVNPADLTGGGAPEESVQSTSDLAQRCQTGADANRDEDCRVVAIDNSLKEYWSTAVRGFRPANTQIFRGGTTTGCGRASSAVGPFYCPPDEGIFLDLGFFDELRTTYGAKGGDFAQAYVLAHEYGHHIQNLTGQSLQLPPRPRWCCQRSPLGKSLARSQTLKGVSSE